MGRDALIHAEGGGEAGEVKVRPSATPPSATNSAHRKSTARNFKGSNGPNAICDLLLGDGSIAMR